MKYIGDGREWEVIEKEEEEEEEEEGEEEAGRTAIIYFSPISAVALPLYHSMRRAYKTVESLNGCDY